MESRAVRLSVDQCLDLSGTEDMGGIADLPVILIWDLRQFLPSLPTLASSPPFSPCSTLPTSSNAKKDSVLSGYHLNCIFNMSGSLQLWAPNHL
jgi:hypothetical protein